MAPTAKTVAADPESVFFHDWAAPSVDELEEDAAR